MIKIIKLYNFKTMKVKKIIIRERKQKELENVKPNEYIVFGRHIYTFLEKIDAENAIGVK